MKKYIVLLWVISMSIHLYSQEEKEKDTIVQLEEVLLKSTRAHKKSPFTYTNIKREKIEPVNLAQDLPVLLDMMPSVVSTSDAGAGVGYTGMRIRGSDATRINVTLNGIPFNDAESHATYWVDLPDFVSSVEEIQMQRGVGTSTNGAAAFGATLALKTAEPSKEAYARTTHSYGSFSTRKHNFAIGSGMHKGFYAEGRLSRVYSDGYIDRAFSDLSSFFTETGYKDKNTHVKALFFGGHEKTYQSWYGTPQCIIDNDPDEIEAFIERNYLDDEEAENLRNSGRTYNYYTYKNQVDDYTQKHYQLHFVHTFSPQISLQTSLNYTHGAGYYEQYKKGEDFTDYFPNSTEDDSGDVIRRKWLDNDFYAVLYSLNYNDKKWDVSFGGGYNDYHGEHFGRIIWDSFSQEVTSGKEYYNNTGEKKDWNMYLKSSYKPAERWSLFVDSQIRMINYRAEGLTSDLLQTAVAEEYYFFNPKAGVSYSPSPVENIYLSLAVSHREPNREDLVKNPLHPVPEKMLDIESGYRYSKAGFSSEVNLYFMGYKDQLILTGALDDVGNPVRQNVDKSYRTGMEVQLGYKISDRWKASMNATFSRNKIDEYKHYVYDTQYDPDTWETLSYEPVVTTYHHTDMSYSPSVISAAKVTYMPLDGLSMSWMSKYVSKQYLDNTSSEDKVIKPYWVNDIQVGYDMQPSFADKISFQLLLNNIFNRLYESNGYTYSYYYRPVGSDAPPVMENFYYPQAGFHFLMGVGVYF